MPVAHAIGCKQLLGSLSSALGFFAIVTFSQLACAGTAPERPMVGWLPLYNDDMLGWLENENAIAELCPMAPTKPEWRDCRAEKLRPKVRVLQLRSAPSDKAGVEGRLAITATPGKGLAVNFQPRSGGKPKPFRPDLYDVDWGYGPYFHQTFLARQGNWFLIPVPGSAKPLWIDAGELTGAPRAKLLEEGDIVSMLGAAHVVLGFENGSVRVRPEQASDMPCGYDEEPPLKPFREKRVPVSALYSKRGHLQVDYVHKRGC